MKETFEFKILRRATENLKVEYGPEGEEQIVEGGELRSFLMSLDELLIPLFLSGIKVQTLSVKIYEPGGRGFESCRARQFSKA